MGLRNGDWGFRRGGLGRIEDLEGVVVVGVVVVWPVDFLLSVGQVAGEEAVGLLPLRIRSEYLEVPCCDFRQPKASVGLEEF